MAKTIVLGLQKGGISKTSSTLCLASSLKYVNKNNKKLKLNKNRILVVDTDSQASATEGSGVEATLTLYDCFAETCSISDAIVHCELYDVLPGDERLTILEKMNNDEIDPFVLKNLLAEVQELYDYILIDVPPNLGNLLQIALIASDYCIIPCEARPFAISKIDAFYETILASNNQIKILGILLTKYHNRTVLNRQIKIALETKARLINTKVFENTIPEGISLPEAQIMQVPLIHYAPKSKVCIAYIEWTREVLKRLEDK